MITNEQIIINLITQYYPQIMSDRIEVHSFKPTFSKFDVQETPFYIVQTMRKTFFLKKFHFSQEKRALNESKSVIMMSKKTDLLVPPLVVNKLGNEITHYKNNTFLLSEYIHGHDLRSEANDIDNDKEFYDFYIKTVNELKRVSSTGNFSFTNRTSQFLKQKEKLKESIIDSDHVHKDICLEYLYYQEKKYNQYQDKILSTFTKSLITHGDFLKQNIIRDEDNQLWLLDWEKAGYGSSEIDLMKTVIFTIFTPHPHKVNLTVDAMFKAFMNLRPLLISHFDRKNITDIIWVYYFFLITNSTSLTRFFIDQAPVKMQMIIEDYNITRWIEDHMQQLEQCLLEVVQDDYSQS